MGVVLTKILIVDDSDLQRALIAGLVKNRMGYASVEASGGAEALAILRGDTNKEIAAVLLDLTMPEMDGRAVLPKLLEIRPGLSVIVVTGSQNITDVVDLIKMGATDYVVKPPNPELLKNALYKAMQLYSLRRELEQLRQASNAKSFSSICGQSPSMQLCLKLAQRAATSDITVFITGESGVGKEILAQAIHAESARSQKPFVAINCGAIPKDLVESTLFGHKKGSFTGAVADAIGKFREAEGGTLFLDEIGELPLDAQVKLLRALQEREVEPVGLNKPIPVNIRIIAATNRDPKQSVQNGHLREDLYYRLNVFPIHIPPLRERRSDIEDISMLFLNRYAALENKVVNGFDAETLKWMQEHQWTGNVRELENTIFRAVLLCDREKIGLDHIQGYAIKAPVKQADTVSGDSGYMVQLVDGEGRFKPMQEIKQEVEKAALAFFQGNTLMAAQRLGIGKSTLYRHRQS